LVYSFYRGGAHFVVLCSALPLVQRPAFSPLQLNWLRNDLARNGDRKPVFVFLHHAPDSEELAPGQALELREALDRFEIAAVFSGHDSTALARSLNGLDCIQVGSARMDPHAPSDVARGFVLSEIEADRLRVWWRPFDAEAAPRLLLEKQLRLRARAPFEFVEPAPGEPVSGEALALLVRTGAAAPQELLLDGQAQSVQWRRRDGMWRAALPLSQLAGGVHQVVATGEDSGAQRVATRRFVSASPTVLVAWRRQFEGSLRSSPVLVGARLALGTTAGEIGCLDADSGELVWAGRSSAAVFGPPYLAEDGTLVVANSSGWVEAFDPQGLRIWRFQMGAPGWLGVLGDGASVFAVDARGRVHALDLASGVRRWMSRGPLAPVIHAPQLQSGRLWLSDSEGVWHGRELESGERVDGEPTPSAAPELAAMAAANGEISLHVASSAERLWTWQAGTAAGVLASPLVRSDGTVFVAGLDGSLCAVRAR
jgi:hypothetical protein